MESRDGSNASRRSEVTTEKCREVGREMLFGDGEKHNKTGPRGWEGQSEGEDEYPTVIHRDFEIGSTTRKIRPIEEIFYSEAQFVGSKAVAACSVFAGGIVFDTGFFYESSHGQSRRR